MFSSVSSSPSCQPWSRLRAENWAGQFASLFSGCVHTHIHTAFLKSLVASNHRILFGSLRILYLLAQVLVSLAAVLLLCLLLKSFLIGPYYKKLHAESKGNKEILVLGMAAFVFFMLTVHTLYTPFKDLCHFRFLCLCPCEDEMSVNFFLLTTSAGDRIFGCFHGAWLFPGRSFAVHTGSHGYNRGHGMYRAHQRFPRHHFLRLYWSDRGCWSVPFVSIIKTLRIFATELDWSLVFVSLKVSMCSQHLCCMNSPFCWC